jgi:hypothetical protein
MLKGCEHLIRCLDHTLGKAGEDGNAFSVQLLHCVGQPMQRLGCRCLIRMHGEFFNRYAISLGNRGESGVIHANVAALLSDNIALMIVYFVRQPNLPLAEFFAPSLQVGADRVLLNHFPSRRSAAPYALSSEGPGHVERHPACRDK